MDRRVRWLRGLEGERLLDRVRWAFVLLNVLVAATTPLEATYARAPEGPANTVALAAYLLLGAWAVLYHRREGRGLLLDLAPFVLLLVGGIAYGDGDAVVGRMVLALFLHALYHPSRTRMVTLGTGYTIAVTLVGAVLGEAVDSVAGYLFGTAMIYVMVAIMQTIATTLLRHERSSDRNQVLTRTLGSLLAERDLSRLDHLVATSTLDLLPEDDLALAVLWRERDGHLQLAAAAGNLPPGIRPLDLAALPAELQQAYRDGVTVVHRADELAALMPLVADGPAPGSGITVPIVTDGTPCGVLLLASAAPLDDDLPDVLSRFATEVALAQQLAEREALLAGVIANSPDLIVLVDRTGRLSFVSPRLLSWTGEQAEDLEGAAVEALLTDPIDGTPIDMADLPRVGPVLLRLVCTVQHDRGDPVAVDSWEVEVTANELADGMRVLNIRDVSDRRRLEAEVTYRANHDSVTGLPNRARFLERLTQLAAGDGADGLAPTPTPPPTATVTGAGTGTGDVAVVLLDLDDFKAINDSLGHAAGDQLLEQVARRLEATTRGVDLAARLGGDEFALLLHDIDGTEHATAIAERVIAGFNTPFVIEGRHVRVSASAGVALLEGSETDAVLRDADLAMYAAKALGKDRAATFHPGMHEEILAFQELRAELERAIELDQLVVHYQPIVDLGSGAAVGVEALVRWQHPTLGLVAPDRFIPVAEETGLIVQLGRAVLLEACREVATWTSPPDLPPPYLSVNLSPVQLHDPALVGDVAAALERSGLQPAQLTLEITETALLGDTTAVSDVLAELRALGVSIAIDDFGTGYSSISHLNRLPVDVIKIDREFVEVIQGSEAPAGVAEAIITLASTLGLRTVAEGVEHTHQLDALTTWGCTRGQGWLWSPARAAEEVRELWGPRHPAPLAPATDA